MRELDDGHYWVKRRPDDAAEVALHENGSWRLHDGTIVKQASFHRIGRRFTAPADAFEDELERAGTLGV